MHISVVIPVFNAKLHIEELTHRLEVSLKNISSEFEVILVDDRSPDTTWEIMLREMIKYSFLKTYRLSRNFGQHYAITAGLSKASGEWIIVMDCDLQDQPEEIPNLYKKAMEGFPIVLARRKERKDGVVKVLMSKLFYSFFGYLTDTEQDPAVANFGIYHRKVIQEVLRLNDYYRVFPVLIQWIGFERTKIDVVHNSRASGKSNYTFSKLLKMATDVIISFSDKHLRLTLKAGVLTASLSFAMGVFYLILFLQGYILVPGFTSIILLVSFSLGLLLTFIGVLGLYIGKMSMQVKNRPLFIIDEE